jgi:hypothetical protein
MWLPGHARDPGPAFFQRDVMAITKLSILGSPIRNAEHQRAETNSEKSATSLKDSAVVGTGRERRAINGKARRIWRKRLIGQGF